MFLIFSTTVFPQKKSAFNTNTIAFISDTQKPMWIETLWLKKNHNEKATKILMDDIAIQKPDALFIAGDVVNLSCNINRWKVMDTYLDTLRTIGISIHACLGNHEVMKNKNEGEKNFQTRFPDHVNTGYFVIQDSIAIVFLNSNFSKMNKEQIEKQNNWYNQKLSELDSNQSVNAIIISCHHAPYTDSKVVSSSAQVQQFFVPAFIQTQKCKLFITGHAHLFQHFVVQGKDFLTIGGGGGLNQPFKKGKSGQTDISIDYKPMFHYLTITRSSDRLKIISRKLKEDFSGVEDGLTFNVLLNK